MQRRVGLAALERHTLSQSSYNDLSTTISEHQIESFQLQLTQFRSALSHFAQKHRKTIASDPTFRAQFQQMCANIGVDPLAGPRKGGWWAEALGFLNDWTFELALQIVDICVSTRDLNGGLIEMTELIRLLRKLRGLEGESKIGEEDVVRSIRVLEPLGAGYKVVDLGEGRKAVRSVQKELDMDQGSIIVLAGQQGGNVTSQTLRHRYGWTENRTKAALDNATIRDGICWIDSQDQSGEVRYWVPASMKWDERLGIGR
jgi:ESCRT-II complex subunit VPS22